MGAPARAAWRREDLLGEQRRQAYARPAHATLDRPDLAVAHRRGLREAQSVGADQKNRLALMSGQLSQRLPEVLGDRPSVLVRYGRGPFDMAGAQNLAAQALLAIEIDEAIAQDRGEPRAHVGAFLETVEVRPRAEQRVLNEVVGLICATAQRYRECAQLGNLRNQRRPRL